MVLKGKYLFISIIFTIFAGKISAMGYLKDIIQQRQGCLEKSEAKLVRQFINKLCDSYYPDKKNVERLRQYSMPIVDEFLLSCLAEYNQTERTALEHHDISSLRAVWAVLAFSRAPEVLSYFDQLIDDYITKKPIFLNYLFEIFGFPTINHPLFQRICSYYDSIINNLPSYKLLQRLGLEPANRYHWSVCFNLTTDGEYFAPRDLTVEELTQRFRMAVRFGSPLVMGDTYSIDIENGRVPEHRCIILSESDCFTVGVGKEEVEKPDLLCFNNFVEHMECLFGIHFQCENIASLSVSRGISRRVVEHWIHHRFVL